MAYLPLNNSNFDIGDKVICIENRFARVFDFKTGFRAFGDETLHFLTLKEEYEILEFNRKRRKVSIIADDGVKRQVPYYRMGVLETDD